jgi:hypothetical protein
MSAQRDAFCFHEMNPACVRFSGTPRPVLNAVDEFQAILDGGDPSSVTVDITRPIVAKAYDRLSTMPRMRLLGDVAFYHLSYVEAIAAHNRNVRFLCTRRDIEKTVASWMKKLRVSRWPSKSVADRVASLITRAPYYKTSNPFMNHDGSEWEPDPVWDKCFPKFEAPSMEHAIRKYCEFYYLEAARLSAQLAPVFRFVDVERMNERDYQSEVLAFVGVPASEQIYMVAHTNRSEDRDAPQFSQQPRWKPRLRREADGSDETTNSSPWGDAGVRGAGFHS